MIISSKNKSRIEASVIIYTILSLLPFFWAYIPTGVIPLLSLLIMFLVMDSIGANVVMRSMGKCLPVLTILVVYLFDKDFAIFPQFLYMFRILLWTVIICWIIRTNNKVFGAKLLKVVLICYLFTCITTYIGNVFIPTLSRIKQDDPMHEFVYRYNVGGFSFAYEIVLLIPLFIYLYNNRIIKRGWAIVALVIIYLTLFKMEYTTAIVYSTLPLILLFMGKKTTIKRLLTLALLVMAAFYVLKPLLADVLYYLSTIIGSDDISVKFADMSAQLSGQFYSDNSDLEDRQELIQESWNLFVANPITGSGSYGGGHSLILDFLSRFGLFGAVLLFLPFRSLYIITVKPFIKTSLSAYLVVILLMNIGLCYNNTLIFYINFVFITPLFAFVYSDYESNYGITVPEKGLK